MTALKLEQFGGMLPAWDDHLLPPGQAALSVNGYLFSGALTGWRQPKLLRNLTNSAAKYAYRLPTITSAKATAYLVFKANPNAGDWAKVGEVVYTFTATVTNPNDVKIGASAAITAQNLLDALTIDLGAGTNAGTLYGKGTVANSDVSQTAGDCITNTTVISAVTYSYLKVVAPDTGAAYNSQLLAESTSNVRLTWLSDFNFSHTVTAFTGGVNPAFDTAITGNSIWLEFMDPDTNVVRTPTVNDQFERYYFASPSLPPQYNTRDRINNGLPPWLLGLNPPGCEPTVSVTGGGNTATLGVSTSTSTTIYTLPANTMCLVRITPQGTMALNDVSFFPATTNSTVRYAAVAYSDNAGAPGQLLATGIVETGVFASVNAVASFLNTPGLNAKVPVWVGIMTDTNLDIYTAGDGTNNSKNIAAVFSNGPPPTAPNGVTEPTLFMWADLTTSDVVEARAYLYTWVTAYGEESAPSPPTVVTGWSNGVWTIGLFTPPPDDMGVVRNITQLRLYRTVSAQGGQTTYFHVADIPIGTVSYTDIALDNVIALNYQMASTTWFPPPEDLQGIIAMPNGMIAGFKKNEIWFCEPYRPHAWPPGYVITTEFPIVGLGVSAQTLVAATNGHPYAATGVGPATMTLLKIAIPEPCISRGSVLGTDAGVYYMSPNGLILVTASTAMNVTDMWITRERWRALVPQKNTRAVLLASHYFCYGTTNGADTSVAQQGFCVELSNEDAKSFTIWPQPGGHRIGFNQLTAPNGFNVDNIIVDPWTGIAMVIQNSAVYYFDFADTAPTMIPYKWRSKILQQNSRKNFEAMKIYFTVPTGTPAQSATRNTAATADASWLALGANQYAILRVYADGVLVTVREIRTSGELLRILSGYKSEQWQFEVEGRVIISNIQVATSVKELSNV